MWIVGWVVHMKMVKCIIQKFKIYNLKLWVIQKFQKHQASKSTSANQTSMMYKLSTNSSTKKASTIWTSYSIIQPSSICFKSKNSFICRSYISFTILSTDQEIIGAGCFNDFPQGLRGKYDNVHENMWEDWLDKAFNIEGLLINSYNSLWLTFFHVDPRFSDSI